jgi:hypothetical protein
VEIFKLSDDSSKKILAYVGSIESEGLMGLGRVPIMKGLRRRRRRRRARYWEEPGFPLS